MKRTLVLQVYIIVGVSPVVSLQLTPMASLHMAQLMMGAATGAAFLWLLPIARGEIVRVTYADLWIDLPAPQRTMPRGPDWLGTPSATNVRESILDLVGAMRNQSQVHGYWGLQYNGQEAWSSVGPEQLHELHGPARRTGPPARLVLTADPFTLAVRSRDQLSGAFENKICRLTSQGTSTSFYPRGSNFCFPGN